MYITTTEHGVIKLVPCLSSDNVLQEYKSKENRLDKVYLDRIEKITGKCPKLTKRT